MLAAFPERGSSELQDVMRIELLFERSPCRGLGMMSFIDEKKGTVTCDTFLNLFSALTSYVTCRHDDVTVTEERINFVEVPWLMAENADYGIQGTF